MQKPVVLPNFLIVGAMKAGTSALAYCMQEHPSVFLPDEELHFFNSDDLYLLGLEAYRRMFTGYRNEPAVGEKTPTYSYHPLVPRRIRWHLPEVKLIWILRNPVDRAYSHYWFFVGMGKERLHFMDAIEREASRMGKDFTMAYRDRSIYAKQIRRYLQCFPLSQMLFLLYENFRTQPHQVLRQVYDFLGVDRNYRSSRVGVSKNMTHLPRSVFFQWAAYAVFSRKGARLLRLVKRLNRNPVPGYPPMCPEIRQRLVEFFRPHNVELSELTGLDLQSWAS